MMSSAPQQPLGRVAQPSRTGAAGLFAIAATVALVHLLTNNRYGFHRDELQFLSDARHLDLGVRCIPSANSIPGTDQPGDFRPFDGRPALILGAGPIARDIYHRANDKGVRRRTACTGCFGTRRRAVAAAAF